MAKKRKLTKKQRKYLQKGGRAAAIGGLAAAALLGGPAATAIATPLAAGLAAGTTRGDRKKKLKVAKKFLIGGAALTAGTAAASLAAGKGLSSGLLSSGRALLSGGSSPESAAEKHEELLNSGLGQRSGDGNDAGLGLPPVDPEDPGLAEDVGDEQPEVDVDGKPIRKKESNTALLGAAALAGYLILKKKSA